MNSIKLNNIIVLTDNPGSFWGDLELRQLFENEPVKVENDIFSRGGILLDISNTELCRAYLEAIRNHNHFFLQPVALSASISATVDPLADGIAGSASEAMAIAQPIFERINSLDYRYEDVLTSQLFRVILYYYVRNRSIRPVKDWTSPSLYLYPELVFLTGLTEQVSSWLTTQEERLLLEREELVDRVRCCPKCSLVSPNYIDVCMNCRSIHIRKDMFLHCFTCGAVQPEKEFHSQGGSLICPQCNETLRHIGTDYDRPLENYTCSDCQSTFVEPLIIAVCPRCETVTETEDLEVRNYSAYRLTEKAIMAARTGVLAEPTSLMDDLQNVSFKHFSFQLNWFFSLVQRYPSEIFTVSVVRLTNLKELESSIGSARLLELMEEYVKRVRSSLRVTDFTSRGGQNDLWLLLPKTDIKQRETVLNRILSFSEETRQRNNREHLEIKLVALTVPTQTKEHDSGEKIRAMLDEELKLD